MNKSYLNDKTYMLEHYLKRSEVFIKSLEKLIESLDYLKSENKEILKFLMIAQQILNLKY